MPRLIRPVQYCYVTVPDEPGQASAVLSELAAAGVDLFAFHVLPGDPRHTRLALFPGDMEHMIATLGDSSLQLRGPHRAILIQGDDELGTLVDIHRRLFDAGINVISATGVSDSSKGFGYIIYLRDEDIDRALQALGI